MARPRTTRKPCPGCGSTGSYRRVDEVCSSCREILENKAYTDGVREGRQMLVALARGEISVNDFERKEP